MAPVDYEQVIKIYYYCFKSESIDYGIMEHTVRIHTLPGNCGWDDVGSWFALEKINRIIENVNMVNGDVITIGTKNSIIVGNKN